MMETKIQRNRKAMKSVEQKTGEVSREGLLDIYYRGNEKGGNRGEVHISTYTQEHEQRLPDLCRGVDTVTD